MSYKVSLSFLILAGITVLLFIARKILFDLLRRIAAKAGKKPEDLIFVTAIQRPSGFLIFALALYVGLRLSDIPEPYAASATKAIHLSVILTITIAVANISGRALVFFLKKSELPISVTGLLNAVIKAIVFGIGFLMMLNALGISITPIITALGVGGLAMALALQDTLSNLFAGIHILAEHTIRVGDFIKMETGQEGTVEDIGWRTTRIRMPQNNMVIVPNSKLSQSVVINYYLPARPMVITSQIGVSYDADPDVVEKVLLDVARSATREVSGLLPDPAPVVRFVPGFGASSLDFTLICHIRELAVQQAVLHELNKRIFKRFKQEKIEIPFPTQMLYVKNTLAASEGQSKVSTS